MFTMPTTTTCMLMMTELTHLKSMLPQTGLSMKDLPTTTPTLSKSTTNSIPMEKTSPMLLPLMDTTPLTTMVSLENSTNTSG